MKATHAGAAVLVAALLGWAFGRHAQPPRIEERERVVEVERGRELETASATTSESTAIARTTTSSTTWSPDGTVTTTTREEAVAVRERIVEVEVERVVEVERRVEVEREVLVDRAVAQWRVAGELGLGNAPARLPVPGIPRTAPVVAGIAVERRIAGPVWVGAWASSSYAAGVRVAVEF